MLDHKYLNLGITQNTHP
jgi:hypothetical protein